MASKKTKRSKASGAAFVRTLAHDVPAKEVVARAKSRGINLKESTVYSVRSEQRKAERKRQSVENARSAKPKPAAKPKKVAAHRSDRTRSASRLVHSARKRFLPMRSELPLRTARAKPEELSAEEQLRVLVLRVGLDRTERLLQQLRRDTLVFRRALRHSPLPPPID